MELVLTRTHLLQEATTGVLTVNGAFECYIGEDTVRAPGVKIPGKTAISAGRFEVIINWSDRFKRRMPLLLGVPDFTGVRIHWGNSAVDTDGCLLTGKQRDAAAGTVQLSVAAFNELFDKLDAALQKEKVFITIH